MRPVVLLLSKLKELTGIKLPKLCPRTWTMDLLNDGCCSEEDRGIILCGMWSLWCSRNDRRHGKTPIEHKLAINWAVDACFHLMTEANVQARDSPRVQSAIWSLPPEGSVKINSDGAFDAREMTGATGAIARGPGGVFLVEGSRWLPSVASV